MLKSRSSNWRVVRDFPYDREIENKFPCDDYQTRKKKRIEYFNKYSRKKLITCSACSGSGYYDNTRSPKCGCCNGTGKIRED